MSKPSAARSAITDEGPRLGIHNASPGDRTGTAMGTGGDVRCQQAEYRPRL